MRRQQGYTLVEVIFVVAVMAVIVSVAWPSSLQLWQGTGQTSLKVTALENVQNAANWFSRDAQMAQTTTLANGAGPVSEVTLTWVDKYKDGNVSHSIRYYVSQGRLMRTYDGTSNVVGTRISYVGFSLNSRTFTMTVRSTPGNDTSSTSEGNYIVQMRSTS